MTRTQHVIPAKAGMQCPPVIPAKAWMPCRPVIPAKAGIQCLSAPGNATGFRLKAAMTAFLLTAAASAIAQQGVAGLWRSFDDKTGEAKAEIRITDAGGNVSGRIEKLLRKNARPDARCEACEDERKDKPIVGLEIIRGGRILDPENGREYRLRLTPLEDGRKLEVRGYLGPFYRNQVWVRAQ
jgi:uncharacterized protein (DUF2147 family)